MNISDQIITHLHQLNQNYYGAVQEILETICQYFNCEMGIIGRQYEDQFIWLGIKYQGGELDFITYHYQNNLNTMGTGSSFDQRIYQRTKREGFLHLSGEEIHCPPGHPPIDNLVAIFLKHGEEEGLIIVSNREGDFSEEIIQELRGITLLLKIIISFPYQQIQVTPRNGIDRLIVHPSGKVLQNTRGELTIASLVELYGSEQWKIIQQMEKHSDKKWFLRPMNEEINYYLFVDRVSKVHNIQYGPVAMYELYYCQATHRLASLDPIQSIHNECTRELTCVVDLSNRRFITLNQNFCQALGYEYSELFGREFTDFIYADDVGETIDYADNMRLDDSPAVEFQNRYIHRNGHLVYLSWNAITINGIAVATASVITKYVEMNQSLEKMKVLAETSNQAKDSFISRASHEIRTPLNSVYGFGQLITMKSKNPLIQEYSKKITKSCNYLLNIVNDILQISKMAENSLNVSLENVKLSQVFQDVMDITKGYPNDKKVNVNINYRYSDVIIISDLQKIRQIILNLVTNAIKYNRVNGEVNIFVEVSLEKQVPDFQTSETFQQASQKFIPKYQIKIHIQDTGIGIPEKDQKQLFEPFFRSSNAAHIEGVGLGLNYSKKMARFLGGDLYLQRSDENGSEFVILAWASIMSPDLEELRQDEKIERLYSSNENVLVYIEDNASNYELVNSICHGYDLSLYTFVQGQLGFEMIRHNHPKMVLLDYHLPDTDGLTLLQKIRNLDHCKKIPIYMLTADTSPNTIDKALRFGASDVFHKPLDITKLLEVLEQVFEPN